MSSQQPFDIILNGQPSSNLHCAARSHDLHNSTTTSSGEVQHIQKLSDHIGALFLNDEYSDVSLIVEGQKFRAHRVILAARSGNTYSSRYLFYIRYNLAHSPLLPTNIRTHFI